MHSNLHKVEDPKDLWSKRDLYRLVLVNLPVSSEISLLSPDYALLFPRHLQSEDSCKHSFASLFHRTMIGNETNVVQSETDKIQRMLAQ